MQLCFSSGVCVSKPVSHPLPLILDLSEAEALVGSEKNNAILNLVECIHVYDEKIISILKNVQFSGKGHQSLHA